ncbi:hypothetical protein J6590_064701 [Homalodisca vitripennis]|nr:hypothetical protein J6590_064701 [Homalodisca vitripennis]
MKIEFTRDFLPFNEEPVLINHAAVRYSQFSDDMDQLSINQARLLVDSSMTTTRHFRCDCDQPHQYAETARALYRVPQLRRETVILEKHVFRVKYRHESSGFFHIHTIYLGSVENSINTEFDVIKTRPRSLARLTTGPDVMTWHCVPLSTRYAIKQDIS